MHLIVPYPWRPRSPLSKNSTTYPQSEPPRLSFTLMLTVYQANKFKRWGISNYMSWEVSRICQICEAKGWKKPSVYQGIYNAVHRAVEGELLPCLRFYGISFYAFNPLAGGVLTARYHRELKDEDVEPGSRFDPGKMQGKMYRMRYVASFFSSTRILSPASLFAV